LTEIHLFSISGRRRQPPPKCYPPMATKRRKMSSQSELKTWSKLDLFAPAKGAVGEQNKDYPSLTNTLECSYAKNHR
jgi:hypothetical protein